jgi:hypothetical protein
MVARIPHGPDVFHAVPILGVEFVDHVGEKTSELALHVVGDAPEQVAALEAMEGAHLIEVTERRDPPSGGGETVFPGGSR